MIYRIVQIHTNIIYSQCLSIICVKISYMSKQYGRKAPLSNFQNRTMYILTCKNPNRMIQNSLAGMPYGLGRGSSKPKSKRDRLVWSWNQAKRSLQETEQTYTHAINRGQLANSWSHHVSPIHIWFHGPFNDVVCITQDPCNHEGTERMTNKVSLFQAPNLEADAAKQTAGPQLSRILLLELDIGFV